MTFEGFDAAMLIDVQQTPPLLLPTELDDRPTLQNALAERPIALASNLWLDGGPTGLGDIVLTSLRPLGPHDMLLIAGGNGSEFTVWGPDPWDWWDPTLPNDPYPDGPYGGGGGGTGEQGGGAEEFDLTGRDCPTDRAAARDALRTLYTGSPTAQALIDAAASRGVELNLIVANLAGAGPQARFENNQILWDPFLYAVGTNSDGSTYSLTPIMILAHELVHAGHADDPAYQGHASEALVMSIANQIAAEMNATTGSNFDTSRDSHVRTGQYYTGSIISTVPSIARPGCN